jgi:hypothetical protein
MLNEAQLRHLSTTTRVPARSTAEAVAGVAGRSVHIDDRFNDMDYGVCAGRAWNSMHVKLRVSTGVTIGFSPTTAQSRGLCVGNG